MRVKKTNFRKAIEEANRREEAVRVSPTNLQDVEGAKVASEIIGHVVFLRNQNRRFISENSETRGDRSNRPGHLDAD